MSWFRKGYWLSQPYSYLQYRKAGSLELTRNLAKWFKIQLLQWPKFGAPIPIIEFGDLPYSIWSDKGSTEACLLLICVTFDLEVCNLLFENNLKILLELRLGDVASQLYNRL